MLSPMQAQLDISMACVSTIRRGLDILHLEVLEADSLMKIVNGKYRLLAYALEFWLEHCLCYASTGGFVDVGQRLCICLTELYDAHRQYTRHSDIVASCSLLDESVEIKADDDRVDLYAHMPIYHLMKEVLRVRRSASRQLCANGEGKFKHVNLDKLKLKLTMSVLRCRGVHATE
jgi:hypothetical protein